MKLQPYRYIIDLHTGNDEDGYTHEIVSFHRTKVAAIRALKRARNETAWLYEGEWHFVECHYWDAENGTSRFFREDDYQIVGVEQFGECDLCQQQERPCYGRYADERCKMLAAMTKGPWRVYALVDPTDGQIRYIGSTERLLQKRLSQHICQLHGPRGEWIASLLTRGIKPTIHEIAQYNNLTDALTREYQEINTLPNLTNAQRTHRLLTLRGHGT